MTEDVKFGHVSCGDAKPYHYTECGLDNIYLCGGYIVETYEGEDHIGILNAYELHQAIGRMICKQKRLPSGKELRFLRKEMNLTQHELAGLVGVTDQTIARYEKEIGEGIPAPTDRLLRAFYLDHLDGNVDIIELVEFLAGIDETAEYAFEMSFDPDEGWSSSRAA